MVVIPSPKYYASIIYYLLPYARIGGITGETVVVEDSEYDLPLPSKSTNVSVEEAILLRRSVRDYSGEPIGIGELLMILWVAQGIADVVGKFRSAPSAGATYPLEIYLVVGENTVAINETSFPPSGIYRYIVERHSITLIKEGDCRDEPAEAALNQR